MKKWAKEERREALAAISTLKRALGISNHTSKTDTFGEDHYLHIYTRDEGSAQLVGELLWRYANGKNTAFYDAHPERKSIRDTIDVTVVENECYDTSMHIIFAPSFTKAMRKMVDKYIASDNRFVR